MAQLSLQHIQKFTTTVHVVKDFNLEIEDKEFIVLLALQAVGNQRRCA